MGSVGEPRHGRPNATYVIYDTDTEKVTLREVEYNYQKTCDPIGEATQLIEKYGADAVQQLWDSVSRKTVEWIRSLDFGFFELDCLLIHGSSLSVDDEPEVPPRRGELPSETITRRDFPALGKIYYMTTIDETFT